MGVMGVKKYLAILLVWLSCCMAENTNYPCSVVDGENIYDLSALGAKDFWHQTETLHTGRDHSRYFYVSVCHPLRNAPESCALGVAGVCSVSMNEDGNREVVANAGLVSTVGPRVAQNGWIEYRYEGGEHCDWNGRNRTHQASLNIMCPKVPSDETPGPVLMSSSGCEFVFAWMTSAGCPKKVDNTAPKTCLIKFPNSSHTLNLHSLHTSTYYTAKWDRKMYEINICGAVMEGKCSDANTTVCQVDGDDKTTLATTDDMQLKWMDTVLVLTYGGQDKTVEIQFHCDRQAADTQLHFVDSTDTKTSFTMKTSVVCTPQPQHQCVIDDYNGNIYDLRQLNKKSGNWEAYDTSPGGENVLYHINICGQVNNDSYYHCPSGPIGACQTSSSEDGAYNLGFLTSDPSINKDGSITLLYTNGDPCNGGMHSRSTRINLMCHQIEQEPIFIEKTETCEYVFKWFTPAACPRHKTKGNNCKVRDPLYGNLYDFNPLRNSKKDYALSQGTKDYLINLCGPLVSSCTDNAGICLTNNGIKYSAGSETSDVIFHDGTLSMKFENGSRNCGPMNKTRSSNIIFFCNHDKSGRDGPEMFLGTDECTLNFVWNTEHACPPFHIVDCTLSTKDGRVFDLNELSSPNINQDYFSPDGKKKYVFNVCRSVVHSKLSRCQYTAGACILDLEHEDEAMNIGEVNSGLYLEDDKLMIKYSNGDICDEENHKQYETVIDFICDKSGRGSYPRLVAQENCTYFFELKTPHACPKMMQTNSSSIPSGENCRVNSSFSGHVFDLSPLKKASGYEVHDDSDLHLILNVCDNVSKEMCPGDGSGACSSSHDDHTNVISAGKANSELHILQGFLFLHYTGGDTCNNSTISRSTFISFICGAENVTQGPVLIHDDLDRCTYFVNWYTDLACERRINCYADSMTSRFDLSPLILSTRNYEVVNPQNPKEKFYMNVCRPLNPITGLNCKPGSAACLSTSNSDLGPLNLGHPAVGLVYVYNEGVKMMYTHGSTCPNNTGYDISTMTHFICDKNAGKGTPMFMNITHDCQYQFEWRTSLVCEHEEEPSQGPVCQIRFDDAKANVNLLPLQKPDGYTVKFNDKEYNINVCGPACNKSGVCTTDGDSYGLSDKSELKWDYKTLVLTYYEGSSCIGALSGHRTTSIYFECDMNAGYGHPVPDELMNSVFCKAIFHWKTNLTCVEALYNNDVTSATTNAPSTEAPTNKTDGDNGKTSASTDEDSPSPASSIIAVIFVVFGLAFVAVLVLFKSTRGKRVLNAARRIIGGRGYTNIGQTRTESSTLLGTTVSAKVFRVDESDDDLLRV